MTQQQPKTRKQSNHPSSKKLSNKKGRPRRNRLRGGESSREITVINNAPVQTRCMRYMGSIISTTDIRVGDLTSMLVAVTSGSTVGIKLIEAVRLRRVGITLMPGSDTNVGTFAFTWQGDYGPHTTQTMVYSQGVPAKWNFYPPEGSLASFWFNQDVSGVDSTSVFDMDPDNSTVKVVMDLDFEYVIATGISSTVTLTGASSLTGIAAICLPLATDELTPVGIHSDIV